jgi:threonine dehydratase
LLAITIKDVLEAQERISRVVKRTPLLRSSTFSEWSGFEVFLKAENLQKTGSFKFRGASNKVMSLSPEEGRKGVVTGSSGNHGQAVACVAARFGYGATVVMPEGGSPAKAASIKGYDANLIYCGTTSQERLAFAEKLRKDRGAVFIHPYDDPLVMAGQGTAGLEIIEDLEDASVVLAPTGGCGLISGIAVAVKEKKPGIKVFGVEPAGSNSTGLSYRNGRRTALDKIETVADGIRTTIPGELTFPLVQKYVDGMIEVTDGEILYAQRMLLERCKLLAEPTGAVALAAILSGALARFTKGGKVVALLSGGNVAMPQLAEYLLRTGQNA